MERIPKSTASGCVVPIRSLKKRRLDQEVLEKAMKQDLGEFCLCRACLNPSSRVILDKVLPCAFSRTCLSRILSRPSVPTQMVHS
jgi:hypothetical protein